MSELYYQIALGLIESVGPITAKKLISYCGGVEAVFSERYAAISKIPGVAQLVARNVTQFNQAERVESELKFIADHKIAVHFYLDDDFPHRLKYCEDGPILIYRRGKDILNHTRMVSIVGTRNATKSGKAFCEELIEQLIPHDVVVVSGLAYGIDITAHRACLKYGVPTIGVLAHGLDRIYPALHRKTAIDMQHSGALVTEFMSQTNPDRENFPSRNRIVGGMTDATIVIESREPLVITATSSQSRGDRRTWNLRDVYDCFARIRPTCSPAWMILSRTWVGMFSTKVARSKSHCLSISHQRRKLSWVVLHRAALR
jgi:DNA processing protein